MKVEGSDYELQRLVDDLVFVYDLEYQELINGETLGRLRRLRGKLNAELETREVVVVTHEYA